MFVLGFILHYTLPMSLTYKSRSRTLTFFMLKFCVKVLEIPIYNSVYSVELMFGMKTDINTVSPPAIRVTYRSRSKLAFSKLSL